MKKGSYVYVTDAKGRLRLNTVCPVGCGVCCYGWRDVDELQSLSEEHSGKQRCPNLRSYGCKLKRSKRPLLCQAYLCELAGLAIQRRITVLEANQVIKAGAQVYAYSFLGIEKPKSLLSELEQGRIILSEADSKKIARVEKGQQ